MAVSVLSAAKRVGETSQWTVTHLTMQKIIYLAHMFWLGIQDEPLVHGNFQAWDFGPVHPVLYHRAKIFGREPVENIFQGSPNIPADMAKNSGLDKFTANWGHNGPKLIAITHSDIGAWAKFYDPDYLNIEIPNEAIKEEYMRRAERAAAGRA